MDSSLRDSDSFQNLTIDFLVQRIHLWQNFHEAPISFSREPNCGKTPCLTRNPSKIHRSGSSSEWLTNFNQLSMSTDAPPLKCSWRSKTYFYVKMLTDKHTDKQTDKRWVKHGLLGGGHNEMKPNSFSLNQHTHNGIGGFENDWPKRKKLTIA